MAIELNSKFPLRVDINSGAYDLIFSQNFLTENREYFQLDLYSLEETLRFVFHLREDNENKNSRLEVQDVTETTLVIVIVNFEGSSFLKKPWYLGSLYNRMLYMLYKIEALNDDILDVSISFYLGKEAKNG